MSIQKVRIPELSTAASQGTPSLDDRLPIWLAGTDKTVSMTLLEIRTLLLTGGNAVLPTVIDGGEYIHKVTALEHGTQIVALPTLAGIDFNLERGNNPPLIKYKPSDPNPQPDADYEVLQGGGFRLRKAGDLLIKDERFKLRLFTLTGQSNNQSTTAGKSWITDKVVITGNKTLTTSDLNKLYQLRGGSNQVTVTLPDISDIPDHTVLIFEAVINNQKQQAITTQGGQFIYLNNTSYNTVYISAGEALWLYRDEDGFVVLNGDFESIYREVGREPKASFAPGLNQLVCKGQLIKRKDYPRLWQVVQTFGFALVSDTLWNTANVYRISNGTYVTTQPSSGTYTTVPRPYRGCFSTGTITDNNDPEANFRLPDLTSMFLRGLKTDDGTADTERYYNRPGGYQRHELESHGHSISTSDGLKSSNDNADPVRATTTGTPNTRGGAGSGKTIGLTGGAETRGEGIGVLYVINF